MRLGPTHHIFKSSRPDLIHRFFTSLGPVHHMAARPMKHGFYMGRPDNYVRRSVDLTGRPTSPLICCPVLTGAYEYADVVFYLNCCFSVVFLPVWIHWDSYVRPMRHT